MEIKGIMNLDAESELFEAKAKTGKEESLGVKLSMDWELDRITLCLTDKGDNPIASLVFENSVFQEIVEKVMPPSSEEIKQEKEPTEEEKKQFEKDGKEDMEYMEKHPIKKEIEEYHKEGE